MCGIVGIIRPSGGINEGALCEMRDRLWHRGCDGEGIWISTTGQVGFGHRRLAIVDLSPAGAQPMIDREADCVVVYNGEIYNWQSLRTQLTNLGHSFTSQCDTEVLIAAYKQWGMMCTQHLSGMFAFAIWDSRRQRLFLARDRSGEKPLFFWHSDTGLVFASELKAILQDENFPRRINRWGMAELLSFGFVPAPMSIFEEVGKLAPGESLIYHLHDNTYKRWRYWRVPTGFTGRFGSPFRATQDYVEYLDDLLENAVQEQMVADVPVGVLLSGGIDSGLVTAMATRLRKGPVRTYTMIFPGLGRFNEQEHANSIAKHFGTQHSVIEGNLASFGLLPKLAEQFDEPVVDSSMLPTFLVCQLIRSEAKVALGGDGCDELFGGYTTYHRLKRLMEIIAWSPVPNQLIRALLKILERTPTPQRRGRLYLEAARDITYGKLPSVRRLFTNLDLRRLIEPEYLKTFTCLPTDRPDFDAPNGLNESKLYRLLHADFTGYLSADILAKVDRSSMLTSLESRAPWLDYRIIEFAFGSVPDNLKVDGGQRKILPKLLARRLFPAGYDFDRKQGFSVPFSAWFKQGGRKDLHEMIYDNLPPIFCRKAVVALLKCDNQQGAPPEQIFGLALIGLWAKRYTPTF